VTQKQAWGEDRVYFRDESGRLQHVPLGWTSAAPTDIFREVAAGQCRFTSEDLLRLADLVGGLTGGESALGVKTNTPPASAHYAGRSEPRRTRDKRQPGLRQERKPAARRPKRR
jgi:hypothetical protein